MIFLTLEMHFVQIPFFHEKIHFCLIFHCIVLSCFMHFASNCVSLNARTSQVMSYYTLLDFDSKSSNFNVIMCIYVVNNKYSSSICSCLLFILVCC